MLTRWLTHLQKRPVSTLVLATTLVRNFTVVVLVGGAAEQPASSPELQNLQQQQTGHGGQALLEQEAVPQQEEQLVHPLAVHLLQLLADAMKLQHQAVHLQREVEETMEKKTGEEFCSVFSQSKEYYYSHP